MSQTILDRIVANIAADLVARQAARPLEKVRADALAAPPPRPLAAVLRPEHAGSARLIAEIKRASPSKGPLCEACDPVAQARAYAAGGAAAISVLTEPHYFRGSLDDLAAVRAEVGVPVLRKDFLLDLYQVYEARASGADAVLLLCALLDDSALRALLALTRDLGMEALVEAHDAVEVARAVVAGATVIGVNSRDLRTFAVDPDVVRSCARLVPPDRLLVAESGVRTALDVVRARAWGASAVLVGEVLMRAPDPVALARVLAGTDGGPTAAFFAGRGWPFVKLCSIRDPEAAAVAARAGADAIGLIFAPARRQVSAEQCHAIAAAARSAAQGVGRPPLVVGVFVNATVEEIVATSSAATLDAVQLSGDESPDYCREVRHATGLPMLKALPVAAGVEEKLDAYALAGVTILLEPDTGGAAGGTGQRADWVRARTLAARWPLLLAGGLDPANVGEAIIAVAPRGVDVSSGTETGGLKDPEKLRQFVARARAAGEARGTR
jgi:indole-3-glycerol phosphate synthase/phosphoribosylanthranilate isomerase/anthranilate synthase/indole-3-glycerol phosphate synthase/phosphoribosylanthranilate isomerase